MGIAVAAVGWTGAALLLIAYALASAGRIPAGALTFQLLNLFGAAALTLNSGYHHDRYMRSLGESHHDTRVCFPGPWPVQYSSSAAATGSLRPTT